MKNNYCPVCGFQLFSIPWNGLSPSDEICPSCRTQFGYDDAIKFKGSEAEIDGRYEELRKRWIGGGMEWWSTNPSRPKPNNWDPKKQLLNIGIDLSR